MTTQFCEPCLEVRRVGNDTFVRFVGATSLGEEHIESLSTQLADLTFGRGAQRLRLDLAGVEFLGSSAIGKLIRLYKSLHEAGGELAIVNPRPEIREVLVVTGLSRMLGLAPAR